MLKSKKEGFLSIIQKEKRKMAYPLFMSNEKREVGFRLCTTYGIGKELACAADKFVQFCGSIQCYFNAACRKKVVKFV